MKIISIAIVLFVAIFAIVADYDIDPGTLWALAGVTVFFVAAAVAVGILALFVLRKNSSMSNRK